MNVTSTSALYSGVQAFQNGTRTVEKAGAAIATQSVRGESANTATPQADLASQLIDQDIGKYQALAGSKVMQTAQETLGTLIDTRA